MPAELDRLDDKPVFFPGCCAGLSKPMLKTIANRLPQNPAMVLSIGCGSGLLEGMLLLSRIKDLNIFGVEVPPCINKYLPDERMLRVPCTASLHPDAWLASALLFVYPRKPSLLSNYMDNFVDGALEQVVWLGPRNDWPEIHEVLKSYFYMIETVEGPGLSEHELLVFATLPHKR
ncbi:hypothetical protein LTR27_006075 [Elasticomyces elasticus]|nr:hypothetical protein LTR27_006075 [Elasticomyces elasticus]